MLDNSDGRSWLSRGVKRCSQERKRERSLRSPGFCERALAKILIPSDTFGSRMG
jgi:hypothetical protein